MPECSGPTVELTSTIELTLKNDLIEGNTPNLQKVGFSTIVRRKPLSYTWLLNHLLRANPTAIMRATGRSQHAGVGQNPESAPWHANPQGQETRSDNIQHRPMARLGSGVGFSARLAAMEPGTATDRR
ncbi:hypothetical protein D3C85_1446930 [compost metagenome]